MREGENREISNDHSQSRGWDKTLRRASSWLPFSGVCMYSHLAVKGSDMSILSILAPGVAKPNLVPRSWTFNIREKEGEWVREQIREWRMKCYLVSRWEGDWSDKVSRGPNFSLIWQSLKNSFLPNWTRRIDPYESVAKSYSQECMEYLVSFEGLEGRKVEMRFRRTEQNWKFDQENPYSDHQKRYLIERKVTTRSGSGENDCI